MAAFEYQHGSIDRLIMAIKTNPSCPEIRQLSRLLANVIEDTYKHSVMPEIIIPVPLHWRTMLKRGFNQTDGIALALTQYLTPIEICNNLCVRQVHSTPQHLKTKKQRFKGMQNVFAIMPGKETPFDKNAGALRALEDKTVAIIDDVVTTGATSGALATVLINAGAKYVDVWALARTGWHI